MSNITLQSRQQGAALVVGLVLLLVLTVLGVSGMNTATLEWTMATNDQYSENAFQAAETGIDRALTGGDFTTQGTVTSPLTVLPNQSTFVSETSFEIETAPPPRPGLGFTRGSAVAASRHTTLRLAAPARHSAMPIRCTTRVSTSSARTVAATEIRLREGKQS